MKRLAFHPGKGPAFRKGPKAQTPAGGLSVMPPMPAAPDTPAAAPAAPDVNPGGPNNLAGMMQGLMSKASPLAGVS